MLVLALGLLVAVVRNLPGPVFFPLRLVAILFADVFRGIPSLLVIYLLGFGIPGLRPARASRATRSSGRRSR